MPLVCVVAGDPSGDAHAAHLVAALRRRDPELSFTAFGGPRLQEAGATLLYPLTQAAAIGPFDAAKHLSRFVHAKELFEQHLRATRPDAVLLVDFGDFNLPVIAPIAKRHGCRVIYYISPQLWAWGRFRLQWVKACVDRMLVLFQFEERWYREMGVPVTWVGHPMVETAVPSTDADVARQEFGINPARMTVGLLPGSRIQEVRRHLPVFLAAAKRISWKMPGVQFLLPKAPQLPDQLFERIRPSLPGMEIIVRQNRIYDAMQLMDAAIVASGTATLEAAMFKVPMAVVYKTSLPTFLSVKAVIKVPHIAMVNVIAGKRVVNEFVQHGARPALIANEVVSLLQDKQRQEQMREELQGVKDQLGKPGAVERAAEAVSSELRQPVSGGRF